VEKGIKGEDRRAGGETKGGGEKRKLVSRKWRYVRHWT
jgi:hypothetical protein